MNRIIILTFLAICFAAQVRGQKYGLDDCPQVDLAISLLKDTFHSEEDIQVKMVLTNNSKINQKLLFDKPKSTTGGPAWTFVSLTNKRTGKSVLKYGNKRILESQIYDKEQLKDNYYNLRPRQFLIGQYSLFDLAVTTLNNSKLIKGTYEIQVFYCSRQSNTLIFTVR